MCFDLILGVSPNLKTEESGDLIQMYKNLNNLEDVSFISNLRNNFSKDPCVKRGNVGNNMSMRRESFKAMDKNDNCHFVTVRLNFFTSRVTEHWNKSPNIVVNAHSLNSFKKLLDDYMTSICYSSSGKHNINKPKKNDLVKFI